MASDQVKEDLWPLRTIVERLKHYHSDMTLERMYEWERRRATTGFPKPVTTLGRYKLFDINAVEDWYILWRRATEGLGRGRELNGKRQDG